MTLEEQMEVVARAYEAGAFVELYARYAQLDSFCPEERALIVEVIDVVERLLGEPPYAGAAARAIYARDDGGPHLSVVRRVAAIYRGDWYATCYQRPCDEGEREVLP